MVIISEREDSIKEGEYRRKDKISKRSLCNYDCDCRSVFNRYVANGIYIMDIILLRYDILADVYVIC